MRFGVCAKPGVPARFLHALADVGLTPTVVLTRDPSVEPASAGLRQRARAAALRLGRPLVQTPLGDAVDRVSNTWTFCQRLGWAVRSSDVVNAPDAVPTLEAYDLHWWFVFGFRVIPSEVLATARHGALGFHPSLLPAHRGASPLYWTVRAGETAGGYTIYRLGDAIDDGEVVEQAEVPLAAGDDASTAIEHVCAVGARAMARLALRLTAGQPLPPARPAPKGGAMEPRAARDPAVVTPDAPREELGRLVRAGRHLGGATLPSGERVLEVIDDAGLDEGRTLPLARGRMLRGWRCADGQVVALVIARD